MRLSLLFLIFFTAGPAGATPPDMISLRDQVIGASQTQVFILRETSDNLGLHIYGMHDVFLVAKSLETGRDEDIWPVFRVHSASDSTPQTQSFGLEGAVNPFEIMATRGAQYLSYGFTDLAASYGPDAGFDIDGLWVEGDSMEDDAVMAQITQSIAITSMAIQPYPDADYASMTFHSPQEMLAEMQYSPADCSLYAVMTLFRYPLKNAQLVRLGCELEDGQQVSLVVVIPR